MTQIDIYHGADHLRMERDMAAYSTGPYLEFKPGNARFFLNEEPIDEAEYHRLLAALPRSEES